MKYQELLDHRDELIRVAKLANIAHAHHWLGGFAERIERAGLRGEVVLRGPEPDEGRADPEMLAQDFSQSVVEEHFTADEIRELHAVLSFVHDAERIVEARFRLEGVGDLYLPAIRRVLVVMGVLPRKVRRPRRPAAGSAESSDSDAGRSAGE